MKLGISRPKITIVDYGVGNLHSLRRAFQFNGAQAETSEDAEVLLVADALVLPGVGSFEAGMRGLEQRGLISAVQKFAASGKPMLGICLGAQLMLDKGYEFGEFTGLNLIAGAVMRFPELIGEEKVPHIGWNSVRLGKGALWKDTVLASVPEGSSLYFVHSYILAPKKAEDILALTSYGGYEFCSAVRRGNIYGCQFHPEKSGPVGLKIIKNFINLCVQRHD